jgi:hypothetical protein
MEVENFRRLRRARLLVERHRAQTARASGDRRHRERAGHIPERLQLLAHRQRRRRGEHTELVIHRDDRLDQLDWLD